MRKGVSKPVHGCIAQLVILFDFNLTRAALDWSAICEGIYSHGLDCPGLEGGDNSRIFNLANLCLVTEVGVTISLVKCQFILPIILGQGLKKKYEIMKLCDFECHWTALGMLHGRWPGFGRGLDAYSIV